MEKKSFLTISIILLAVCPQAHAGFWNIKPKAKEPAGIMPSKTAPASNAANKKMEARARESLAVKDWAVYLTPIEGKKTIIEMDVLTFSEGKFTSKNLLNKGYPVSGFTIVVSDNGRVDWEVVQTAENGDMAVWKGQLEGEVLRGVLSLHTLKGQLQDFYFTNIIAEQKAVTSKQ